MIIMFAVAGRLTCSSAKTDPSLCGVEVLVGSKGSRNPRKIEAMLFEPAAESDLVDSDDAIRRACDGPHEGISIDLDDKSYGPAFRRYLLFHRLPHLVAGQLNEQDIFYNAYYWFKVFAKQYMAKHGQDAGIEQQAFQMLESVDFEVDWSVIQVIEGQIDSGV